MIKKIILITALAIMPLFAVTCTDNSSTGGNVSVKVDLGGAGLKSFTGISGIQKASGSKASVLPSDIDTIVIKVTSGTEIVYDGVFERYEIADASDSITLDIPVGTALVFTVSAYDNGGTMRYTGSSDPVDLVAGVDASITIILTPVVISQDANFSLDLVKYNGTDWVTYSDPGYLRTANKIDVEVYKPTYDNATETYSLGPESLTWATPSTITYTSISSVTVSNVFVKTYQLVIVKAYAIDNTIAAIGAVILSDLESGNVNGTETVKMVPPGILNITNNATINSYSVEMNYGGLLYTVASGTSVGADSVVVLVPNCKTDIGTGMTTIPRDVRITVNGTPKNQNSASITWKAIDVDFQAWTWTVRTE